jgi:putative spermidine/putrescine transport system ATP-binding protein
MQTKNRAAELDARGIGKTYGDFHALSDISLTIGRGEFLTLLGPSGSGKTTFLMILAGFVDASAGALSMDGADITRLPAEKRGFGMVFQGYALFPHMSVEKNIAFPLQVQGRSAQEIKRRVDDIVDRVGLREHARKRPADLSGGQQQRVALARALVFEPKVLLLDEPFSALDKNLRGSMQDEVRRLHQETGTTFVFVTHDQSEALALSTRVAIFNKGRLQQLGSPREVYEHPANRFVAEFLGDINIFDLSAPASAGELAEGRFEDRVIRMAATAGTPTRHFAIRPEHMVLTRDEPAEARNAVGAVIEDVTYLGAATRFSLRTAGGKALALEMPTRETGPDFMPGRRVWASWDRDQGSFL